MNNRILRVNELLKKEIGGILLKEIGFEGALITITRVETSSNLIEAKVYISVIPDDKIDKVFRFLDRQVYYIQKLTDRRLRMRPIPKIRFVKETMTREAEKIEEILENIKGESQG